MKKRYPCRVPLSLILNLFIGGCLQFAQAQSDAHVITNVQGKVSVKRASRTKYVSAYMGMPVGNDDAFRLDSPGSVAIVTCSNGDQRTIERTHLTLQCQNIAQGGKPVLPPRYHAKRVSHVRGGPETDVFPVLVSPRMTNLLTPYPVIRWLPAKEATSYKVSVLQGPGEVWSTSVSNATEVQYPQEPKFALVPGKAYRVIISTDTHSSTEEKMPNYGFSLLLPDEVKRIKEAEAKIRGLHLPDTPTRLLVAELYANWVVPDTQDGKALNAEAIELLGSVADTKEPAVARLLGNLYLTIGLNGRAEVSFVQALKLSVEAGDLEGQALAQNALGRIFAKTRFNKDEAIQRLLKAKALYQSFGDTDSVVEVDREIQEIQK